MGRVRDGGGQRYNYIHDVVGKPREALARREKTILPGMHRFLDSILMSG